MMKIVIFGASGLVGQALVAGLQADHAITVAGRSKEKLQKVFGSECHRMIWSAVAPEVLAEYDVVINLAGENVGASRWTAERKQAIIDSRVNTTQVLAEQCAKLGKEAPRLINASGIGIYGLESRFTDETSVYDEYTALPSAEKHFLPQVSHAWEAALQPAHEVGIRSVILRFGVILAKQGGMLAQLLPIFKFGLGGIVGSGWQPLSWVAIDDVLRVFQYILQRPAATGVFNIVANEVIPQRVFARTLARVLHRPSCIPLPSCVVKTLFGQMGNELLLHGQVVRSERLHEEFDFKYQYPMLQPALQHLLGQ